MLGAELHHLGRGVAGNAADEVGAAGCPGNDPFGAAGHTERIGRGAVLAEDVPERGVGLAEPPSGSRRSGSSLPVTPLSPDAKWNRTTSPTTIKLSPTGRGVAHDALERGRRLADQRGLDVHRRHRGQTGEGELVD